MVCITEKGSALVRRIREEMVGNLMKVMTHLTRGEQKAWLHIYSKIYDYCQTKERRSAAAQEIASWPVDVTAFRKWNALIPISGTIGWANEPPQKFKQLFRSGLDQRNELGTAIA